MSLCMIGRIDVPRKAFDHPHMREARCLAEVFSGPNHEDRDRVIGTNNGPFMAPPCQLYGWGPNVGRHSDDTGFIYFSPLVMKRSIVHVPTASALLRRGFVYRLWDFDTHWTRDTAPVVCLFAGPMLIDHDNIALKHLQEGVNALARGVREAPRVSKGFRVPLRGECWAATSDGHVELVLIDEAKRKHWVMARCALCERFAVRVDKYFPYHNEMSRCVVHMLRDEVPRETSQLQEAA